MLISIKSVQKSRKGTTRGDTGKKTLINRVLNNT
jgi:hypothetical protein